MSRFSLILITIVSLPTIAEEQNNNSGKNIESIESMVFTSRGCNKKERAEFYSIHPSHLGCYVMCQKDRDGKLSEDCFNMIVDPAKHNIYADPLMNDVNLSDEAVHEMNNQELWKIGVEYLNWPAEMDEELTKEEIHQKLLDAKYLKVGDMHDSTTIIIEGTLKNE